MRRWIGIGMSLAASLPGQAHDYREVEVPGGEVLRYAVVTPDDYDPAKAYPLLLALPPGDQSEGMVEAGIERYWGEHAANAGWIVASPVAPEGTSFCQGAERLVGPLLARLRETFRIEGGRMHLAGASHGGRSAFRVATQHRWEFQSVTVLPGYVLEKDLAHLHRLVGMRVELWVGGDDGDWVTRGESSLGALRGAGVEASLTVLPGEGHVPASLDDGALMAHLVEEHAATVVPGEAGRVHRALDDLHDAAAKGDEDRYFGLYTDDAVFLGTDATERWTLAEFKEYALPWFQRPSAWIYVPQSRHVMLGTDGQVAWFDEELGQARYGRCRGTGVLLKQEDRWRVVHYSLTVPIPNELMRATTQRIHAMGEGVPAPVTTVVLVRHAEKAAGEDPELTDVGEARAERLAQALRSVGVGAVYTTPYRRTRATVAPLCEAVGMTAREIAAGDVAGLAARLRSQHTGEVVVVSGHSNTVPALVRALGVETDLSIEHEDYDNLIVVLLEPEGARMLHLHLP